MQELHERIGEAINLGARHDDEIVYLERTSSGRALVRVVYLVGGRAPLHLTSLGQVVPRRRRPENPGLRQAYRPSRQDAEVADQSFRA